MKSKNAVISDELERAMYRRHFNTEHGRKFQKQHESIWNTYEPFVQDVFTALYSDQGQLHPIEKVHPYYRSNLMLMKGLLQNDKFQALHKRTSANARRSATETAVFTESFVIKNKVTLEELSKRNEQKEIARQDLKDIREELKLLKDQPKTRGNQNQINSLISQATALMNRQQELNVSIELGMDNLEFNQAMDDAKRSSDALSVFTGTGAGSTSPFGQADPLEVLDVIGMDPDLMEFLVELGRLRLILKSVKNKKITTAKDEVIGVEQSDRIQHLLASEYILLDPEYETLFLQKFSEKTLQTYQMQGKEDQGKGPFVITIDMSGSMDGQSDKWAKSITVAILEKAYEERREAYIYFFNTRINQELFFDKRDSAFMQKLKILVGNRPSGGTNFDPPMTKAMEIFNDPKKTWKDADFLIITDGEASISQDVASAWRECREKHKIQSLAVLIDWNKMISHELDKFCDRVYPIDEITTESAAEIVGGII